MSNVYIVRDPNGVAHTRTSASRVYTHTVLQPVLFSERLEAAERGARYEWKTNHRYHTEVAEGKHQSQWATPESIERDIERSKAWLALGLEGHIVEAKNRQSEWLADTVMDDEGRFWVNLGWCGRLDLAQKLASKHPGALILEARPGRKVKGTIVGVDA